MDNRDIKSVSDKDLEQVTGGSFYPPERFDSQEAVTFIKNKGDYVEISHFFGLGTIGAIVRDRDAVYNQGVVSGMSSGNSSAGWYDIYYVEPTNDHLFAKPCWVYRSSIEK